MSSGEPAVQVAQFQPGGTGGVARVVVTDRAVEPITVPPRTTTIIQAHLASATVPSCAVCVDYHMHKQTGQASDKNPVKCEIAEHKTSARSNYTQVISRIDRDAPWQRWTPFPQTGSTSHTKRASDHLAALAADALDLTHSRQIRDVRQKRSPSPY